MITIVIETNGINPLTRESCAYSQRILCDLNEDGVKLIEDFLGNTVEIKKGTNWNSKVAGKEAIASIMLPVTTLRELKKFIACHIHGAYAYFEDSIGEVHVVVNQKEFEELPDSIKKLCYHNPAYYRGDNEIVRGRNVHQFSGRVY